MRLIQEGPRDARIVVVGEAPGKTEDETGKPFQGGAGWLMNKLFGAAGIDRSQCFVTNIAHIRPPDNEFSWFFRKTNFPHLAAGIIQLKTDLEAIRPNLVIALGGQPLRVLCNKTPISDWRGSILESTLVPGLKVISTYHPAGVMRVWDYKVLVEFDLRRAAVQAKFPEIVLPKREFFLDPDPETRNRIVAEMLKADWLAIDIECHQDWKLACVGFSDRSDRAMTIPVRGEADMIAIRTLCESNVPKIMQNGTFDTTILLRTGIHVVNFAWDTMLAHHALFPECAAGEDEASRMAGKKRQAALAKGLAFQTSIYTEEPFYKTDGKLWKATNDLQMFWTYNAKDVSVTREIRDRQEEELHAFGTRDILRHEMALVAPLLQSTFRGIRVDLKVRDSIRSKLETEIGNLQRWLDGSAGEAINVKSNPAVAALLFDKLKLPVVKRSEKTGKPSADKFVINELAGTSQNKLLHCIVEIRQKRDLIERYLDAAVDSDGRMRCSWDITGTRTGRLSSRQSIFGSGTNLQNIPESMRRMFIPDEGKVFISADYSQAEARVVAYLARCQRLIDLFNDPTRDVHRENASRIFHKPPQAVTYEERYLAKRIIHASNYGMREDKAAAVINEDADETGVRITSSIARKLIDSYFLLYPEIRSNYWREVEQELRKSLTLNTPFGRKRTFFGRWSDKFLMEAYAYIPQSTVGDLCCKALVRCYEAFSRRLELGAEVLLNVHDSLLVQCLADSVEEVRAVVTEAMHIPLIINNMTLVIPTDFTVGQNWEKHSDNNPQGLRKAA
jgi:DNA polymerase-1